MTFTGYLRQKQQKRARNMDSGLLEFEQTTIDGTDVSNVWFDVARHTPPEGVRLIGERIDGNAGKRTYFFYYRRLDERPGSAIYLGGDLNPVEPPTRWRYLADDEE